MAAKDRLGDLKTQFEQLKKDSLHSVGKANEIVSKGVQKFADRELKALNDYYKSAVSSLKAAKKDDGLKSAAQKQIDLLQAAGSKLLSNARDSLSTLADARAELEKLVQKKSTKAKLKKAVAPAREAFEELKTAAGKAKKTVEKELKKLDIEVPAFISTPAPAKKTSSKKAAAKKAAPKKAAAKKSPATKTVAKKAAVKKAAVEKVPAKKVAAKKAAPKKAAAKAPAKAAPKKAAVKKVAKPEVVAEAPASIPLDVPPAV